MAIFHREAPLSVKLGAIGVLLCAIVQAVVQISEFLAPTGPGPKLSSVIGLLCGLAFNIFVAWTIAQLNGLFYWFWVVIIILGFAFFLIMGVLWLFSLWTPESGASGDDAWLRIVGIPWLVTSLLLVSPSSLRAFWRHGHLKLGRDVG